MSEDINIDPERAKELAGIKPAVFTPVGNRVLIQVEDNEKQEGSMLYTPASATQEQKTGIVVDHGGSYPGNGVWISPVVSKGDRVMFNSIGASRITANGKNVLIIRNEDIVGKYVPQA